MQTYFLLSLIKCTNKHMTCENQPDYVDETLGGFITPAENQKKTLL